MPSKLYETVLLQINLGHRRAASYDLQLRTGKLKKGFIVLAQEPWIVRGRPVGLDTSKKVIIANCGDEAPSRAMIYHHPDTQVAAHPAFTGRDVAAGLWDTGMPNLQQMMIVSLYWDGKHPTLPAKFIECLKWCKEKKMPIHIAGDFNAHSTLWGGKRDTWRGNLVLKLMFDYDLVLINEGDVATFNVAGKSSVIDLTMTSPECVELISAWGVIVKDKKADGSSYNGSDHRTIETRYLTKAPEKVFRKSMKEVDWKKFRESLANKLRNWEIPRTMDRNELDGHVSFFTKALSDTCDEFSKLLVVKPRDPIINLWFTKELGEERKSVASLGRTAVRTKATEDWDAFHAAQKTYSSNLRRAARACFQKFATDLPDLTDMAKFCRGIR